MRLYGMGAALGGRAITLFQHSLRTALDAVLPPLCLCCGAIVGDPGALCPRCWSGLSFITQPFCACCGTPFETDPGGPDALCGRCIADPPAWDRARAVWRYDDSSKPLILRFKHADRLEGAPSFGRRLALAAAELTRDCDVIVPIPLHRRRLWTRRYNQSALLALALGRESGRPVDPDLLRRIRRTPPQGGLGRDERRRNVAGAFDLRPGAEVTGKKVVLVDDVLTTGATLGECARVLKRAGAAQVDAAVLARAVLPGA